MDETKDKACHHTLPRIYQPRHPENTVLFKVFQNYLETWIAQTHEQGGYVPSQVEKDFRQYLECGLLCHEFARARCTCGHEFLVAFSCTKSRLLKRAMASAHLVMPDTWSKQRLIRWIMFSLRCRVVNGYCHYPNDYAISCITTQKSPAKLCEYFWMKSENS